MSPRSEVSPGAAQDRSSPEVRTLPALVEHAAATHGARLAVLEGDGETRLSFAELAALVRESARAWMAAGIKPGDRVGIWAPNSARWILAALGAHAAGAAIVPLNTRFRGREAAFVLARSGARALAVEQGFLGVDYLARLREAEASLPELRTVVVLRGPAPAGALDWDGFLAGGRAIGDGDALVRARSIDPASPSDLIFTSGTTGRPKGVVSSHAQTIEVFHTWASVVGLTAEDRYLVVNPFFHTFGYKAGWVACLLTGAACLPEPVLDAEALLLRVARERVTVLPGPPTLYQTLLAHPARARHDLSSFRLAVTGAAVIPVELVRRMREELGFQTVLTAYGLTESTGVVTMTRRDDDLETIARTSGRAIPGVEVRVVAPSERGGRVLPPGEPGEVQVRGYNVMRGYWEEPEATRETVDADGWLSTGDVGILDERGNLRITDRIKDMFIVGGFNAYPAEIESLLLAGDDRLSQAAVVGVPDERLGEVGYAYVVLKPGATATAAELVARAREQMANYKAPRHVEVVPSLPLNAMGKVLRYELRARARATLAR